MVIRLLCVLFIVCHVGFAFGQAAGTVSGAVSDSLAKSPMPGANVLLVQAGKKEPVKSTITDADGKFTLSKIDNGAYQLQISFVGYKPKSIPVELTATRTEISGIKVILSEAAMLQEAVILSEKPVIRNLPGKIIFDVAKTVTDGAETAEESFQKIPGVTVGQEGDVTVRGKGNVKILVDGKTNIMAQTNPEQFLKSIPAKSIESIEVNTTPSSKYDASGGGVVINIKLKRGKLEGFNGSVAAGVGTVFDKYNGSTNLNYKKGKINVFGNGNYMNEKKSIESGDANRVLVGDTATYFNIERIGSSHSRNGSGKIGVEYAIDSLHALTYTLDGNSSKWSQSRSGTGDIRNSANRIVNTTRPGTMGSNGDVTFTNAINYRQTYDTTEKVWTIDAAHTYNKHNSRGENTSRTFDTLGLEVPNSYFDKKTVNKGITQNILLQSDFLLPIKKLKDAKFETGVKEEINIFDSKVDVMDGSTGADVRDTLQSNQFKYLESVTAAYGFYTGKYKSFTYSGGVRWEHTYVTSATTDVKQNYSSFFPSISLGYNFTDNHTIMLNYGRYIERPSFWMLNNTVNYINPYTVSYGNPYIKPSFINTLVFGYNATIKEQSLSFSSSFAKNDGTFQQISKVDSNKVTYNHYENAGYEMSTFVGIDGSFKVTKWFDFSVSTGTGHWWFSYIYNNQRVETQRSDFNLSGNATFKFWKNASVQLFGWFNTGNIMAQAIGSPLGGLTIAAKKRFFNDHLTVGISCRDVLNTVVWKNHTSTPIIDDRTHYKSESRVGYLTLTYQFGKQTFQSEKTKGKSSRIGGGAQQ